MDIQEKMHNRLVQLSELDNEIRNIRDFRNELCSHIEDVLSELDLRLVKCDTCFPSDESRSACSKCNGTGYLIKDKLTTSELF